ncbi:hypothetical protein ACFOOK_31910 [Micromonospora krabiensis]|uniref:PknH-like extracellular domain-containing protein n=1 Tax=Micromonospora krabiensis TaxID=307121 RepID=A0A1C3MY95_9ACTN|nr:hypothetical protein [Micromonospora krabiensis]SBV25307.1 hypothetical protein GA0070620_0779 [Micromonospora krabiensis]
MRDRTAPARGRPVSTLALPLLAALTLPTGCTAGEDDAGPAPSAPPPATTPASSAPTGQSSPTADATVVIPTSAFVELPPELRKMPRRTTPTENALPTLCGEEFGTGGRRVTASASMTVTYQQAGAPESSVPQGMIHQTIFTFDGAGASDYLRRVRGAVEGCPSYGRDGGAVRVESRPLPGVGDEALLVTRTWPAAGPDGRPAGGEAAGQIAVIRVDGVATVLDDQGWEGTSGNPAVLEQATREAVRAIETWRR